MNRALSKSSLFLAAFSCALAAYAGEAPLGDANMKLANDAAAKVVKARMKNERPEDLAWLEKAEAADVVIVSGVYDRVQDVFRALQLPHTVVSPRQLAKMTLNAKQLVIINCPGELGPIALEKVRKFVNAGGFLYTTDWALQNVVQRAFPGFVRFNGNETANDVVEVEVKSSDNNFLKHLKLSKENPKWWLESSSYPIRILNPEKVEVLITSREMKKKYGDAPIAVTFQYGDGRVLHIASHFYLQQNQIRTVAEAKKAKAYLKDSVLTAATNKELEKDAAFDKVRAGDLQSAYAAQQVTSNLVIERKKDQGRVQALYNRQLAAPAEAKPTGGPARISAGAQVKVLEERDGKAKVRAMDGEEGWVSTSALK